MMKVPTNSRVVRLEYIESYLTAIAATRMMGGSLEAFFVEGIVNRQECSRKGAAAREDLAAKSIQ